MAEKKITCPHCLNDEQCFEESALDITSYMCFNCGFTSNNQYKRDSDILKKYEERTPALVKEVKFFDYDRNIFWYPSVLNMGKFGMLFPEGIKNNWNWKLAQVRKLTKEEQKDPMYEGHEHTLDLENGKTFGQYEFLDACKEMGIVKDL